MSKILLPSDINDPAFLEFPASLFSSSSLASGEVLSLEKTFGSRELGRVFRVSNSVAAYGNRNSVVYVKFPQLKILDSFTIWSVPTQKRREYSLIANQYFSYVSFQGLPLPELELLAREFLDWVVSLSPVEYVQVVVPSYTQLNAISLQLGFRHSIRPKFWLKHLDRKTERGGPYWPSFSLESLSMRCRTAGKIRGTSNVVYYLRPTYSSALWLHKMLCHSVGGSEIAKKNSELMKILGIKRFSSNLPEALKVLEDYEERYGDSFYPQLKKVK